ncbi:putative olfactory receptor 1F12P [Neosynchiropus ocellatus]
MEEEHESYSVYMMISQVLYNFANSRVFLSYPVCGTLVLYAMLTDNIFPLTLAVMSVERYVAVCFPLRHSSIVTMRSTAAAITLVWAFSFVNVLIRVVLMFLFQVMSWINFVRLMNVTYVFLILLPRGLSPLIYGLRDQNIRPILLSILCCGLKLSEKI